jgi:hypothetical protein
VLRASETHIRARLALVDALTLHVYNGADTISPAHATTDPADAG